MAHKKNAPGRLDLGATNLVGEGVKNPQRDYSRFPHWRQFYNGTNRRPASNPQIIYLQGLRTRLGLNVWNRLKHDLGIKTPGTWGLSFVEAHVLIQSCIEFLEGESL